MESPTGNKHKEDLYLKCINKKQPLLSSLCSTLCSSSLHWQNMSQALAFMLYTALLNKTFYYISQI